MLNRFKSNQSIQTDLDLVNAKQENSDPIANLLITHLEQSKALHAKAE